MARPVAASVASARAAARPAPATGLFAGTRVLTLEGELPVEFLAPGDRIVTRSGARTLRRITARQAAPAEVIRIAAGSLGHDRPEAALTIGPAQPVLVRDWRARALFGAAQATVAAERLVDGSYIQRATLADAQLLTLEFDRAETIYAGGVELACPAVTETVG